MQGEYRNDIINLFDKIENKLYEIIEYCESGKYSMSEIADELKELRLKFY